MDNPYFQDVGYYNNLLWKYLSDTGKMCYLIMGYNKEGVINFKPNYDGMHNNVKPNVGTISKFPDDYPIANCAQIMDGVLGR